MRGTFNDQGYGVLNSQHCLSLWGSNLASVAELLPTAESANGSLELGTDFGMMRQEPPASWSTRHSCSGPPVNAGSTTSSASAVAASARSVPAIEILKDGDPG